MKKSSNYFSRIARCFLTAIVSLCLAWPAQAAASAQDITPPPEKAPLETEIEPLDIQQATVVPPADEAQTPDIELLQAAVEIEPGAVENPSTGEQQDDPPDSDSEVPEPDVQTESENPESISADNPSSEQVGALVEAMASDDLLLVNTQGDQLPLASNEALEILAGADPYFSNGGITYGWTGAGTPESPVCSQAVSEGYCTFSENPINDAIASPLYSGQQLTIEAGDYSGDNVSIAKPVILNPQANITVASITLSDGAAVNWAASGGSQFYLTSMNIFVNPGAYLADAMELAAEGAEITLSPGVFDDDTGMDITKEVSIAGAGSGETVISPNISCNRCSRYFIVNADDVKIHDLTFDGLYRVENGLVVDNHTGLEIYNNEIVNVFRIGLFISDISYSSGGDADSVATATYNIHDNTFRNIVAGGATNDGSAIKIIDNTGPASDHIITGNIFTQTNRAVWIRDSSVTLTANNFYSNKYGIFVEDLDPGMEVNPHNNRFVGNTSRGINYQPSALNDPVINANDNWWGCSGGPGVTGCDSAASTRAGKIDTGSFLKLGLRTDPSTAAVGSAVTLVAFLFSSADGSQAPVSPLAWFNPPVVTPEGTLIGSLEGNIFTPAQEGVQAFSVNYDNGSAAVQITIEGVNCPPGTSDVDGDGNCDSTVCEPGSFDADSDGECESTACEAGTFDSNSDGECEPIICEDDDPATENIINSDGSCSFSLINCEDDNPTTVDILNQDGSCSHNLKVCDDGLATTIDTLNEDGSCSFTTISCDDGQATTDDILNQDGSCSHNLKICDDGLPTTIDTLNADGSCSFILKSCDDGNLKTTDILNADGTCDNSPVVCDDGLATTDDVINEDGSCSFLLKSCDDSDPMTLDTLNDDGTCSNSLIICDDFLPTTDDILNQDGTCSYLLKSCDDQDPRTEDKLNQDGTCSNDLKNCDDGIPITVDILNEDGSCSFPVKICDDSDPTTENILYPDGSCSFPLIVCDDGDARTNDILNPDGTCSFSEKSCDDGSLLTIDTLNFDGSCTNQLIVCDDGLATTGNILNADGSCSYPLIVCDDGDARTNDILNPDGTCSFVEKSCDDSNLLTEDTLNLDGSCTTRLKVCDDGLATTENILKADGNCSFPLVVCDDGLPVTENILNPDGTCTFQLINCDDSDPSTTDSLGEDGTCSHIAETVPGNSGNGLNDHGENDGGEAGFIKNLLQLAGVNTSNVANEIPVTGGLVSLGGNVPTILSLSDGQKVAFSDPMEGFEAGLVEVSVDSLPSALPDGLIFGSGLSLTVIKKDIDFTVLPQPVLQTLSFKIPSGLIGNNLTVLFWNPEINHGMGGWIDLGTMAIENNGEGISIDDSRSIHNYFITDNGIIEIRINFTGLFILAGIS